MGEETDIEFLLLVLDNTAINLKDLQPSKLRYRLHDAFSYRRISGFGARICRGRAPPAVYAMGAATRILQKSLFVLCKSSWSAKNEELAGHDKRLKRHFRSRTSISQRSSVSLRMLQDPAGNLSDCQTLSGPVIGKLCDSSNSKDS